ncbi:GNAT family N-acetyltransferase [Phenylobacterium sp.]|uniref:GNAT family N-acetyltransferase n=1 Tax=Phenylobacterium sp. TaxID=1871053 RepID=UPI0035669CA1
MTMPGTGRQRERIWLTIADPEQPEAELRRLKGFLDRYPSGNLKPRPDDVFGGAIEDSLAFRLQSTATIDDEGQHICAQGGVFDWRNGQVYEIGAISVAPAFQGFGLQKLIMRTAVIRLVEQRIQALDDPEFLIFAAVAEDNIASWRSIESVGFVRPAANHRVWSEVGRTLAAFDELQKRMYVLPTDHFDLVRDAMAQFAADPCLTAGERSLRVVFGQALEHYAAPNFYANFSH